MSNMNLILEKWNRFVEADEPQKLGMTWGQLSGAIEAAREMKQKQITKERQAELAKTLGTEGLKLAISFTGPVGGLIASAASVGEAVGKLFSAAAQEPDGATNDNIFLAAMNISDSFQELIDDKLEDKFIAEILPQIEKMATANPKQPIPNMDVVIRDWLSKQNIGGETGTTVQKGA